MYVFNICFKQYDIFIFLDPVKNEGTQPIDHNKHHTHSSETVIVYREGRRTVSPRGSPVLKERRTLGIASPLICHKRKDLVAGKLTKRPCSLTYEKPHSEKPCQNLVHNLVKQPPERNILPTTRMMRFSGRPGHVKDVVSSLQDVNVDHTRSPSTTPILSRKVPLLGSPKANKKEMLTQNSAHSPNGSSKCKI